MYSSFIPEYSGPNFHIQCGHIILLLPSYARHIQCGHIILLLPSYARHWILPQETFPCWNLYAQFHKIVLKGNQV